MSKIGILATTLSAIDPVTSVYSDVKEGKNVIGSVAKATGKFLIDDAFFAAVGFGPGLAITLGATVAKLGADFAVNEWKESAENMKRSHSRVGGVGSGYVNDNAYSATMRQRSLQAMGGNAQITRNALGSEARRRAVNVNY